MTLFRRAIIASLFFFVAWSHGWASEKSVPKTPSTRTASAASEHPLAILVADVPFVLVPVHVTTLLGGPVMHLESKDFHLFDQNIEHSIKSFSRDDTPISVGVLFDSSGSMRTRMDKSADATRAFLKTANAVDEHFLVEFGDRAKVTVPFTTDTAGLFERIARIRPFGRTSMFDAIHLAIGQMRFAKNKRKAIVIFSDGGDNWSRRTLREIRRSLLEVEIQIYAVGIMDESNTGKLTREELAGPGILDELAELTGGTHLRADLEELTSIAERIGNELRSRYLLGYSPTAEVRDGKYHQVKVTVTPHGNMPDLRISHRPGYHGASN